MAADTVRPRHGEARWRRAREVLASPGLGDAAVLLAIALAVRLVAVQRTAVIFNDGPIFLALAGLFDAGRWPEAFAHAYHPLYPLLVHWLRLPGWEAERVAVAISVVSGSLAVLALRAFLQQAWDRRVAFGGALLLAVHPYAVRFSADVQSDALYLLLFLTGVAWIYVALRDARPGLACAAGVASALAYWARPEGVGVVLVGSAVAAVAWLRGGWTGARTAGWLAALWAGALVVASPYVLTMRGIAGGWRLTQKKSLSALLGLDPQGLEWPVPDADAGGAWLLAGAGLAVAAFVVLLRMRRGAAPMRGSERMRVRVGVGGLVAAAIGLAVLAIAVAPAALPTFSAVVVSTLRPELLLMLVVGVASRVRSGPQGRSLFVALFMLLYAVVLFGLLVSYGYVSRRHVLPPVTLLFGYVATGVLVVADLAWRRWGDRRGLRRIGAGAVAGILLGALAVVALPKAWHDHRGEELAGRLAAEWVRAHAEGGGMVAGNRSKLGYYAGRAWKPLRDAEGRLRPLDLLHAEGVRWLIAESDVLGEAPGGQATLPSRWGVRLVERHRAAARGREAVAYEVARAGG